MAATLRALTALTDHPVDFLTAPPTEPVLCRRDPADLTALLSMTAVEDMLADHALGYPLLTVSRAGKSLSPRTYTHTGGPQGTRNPARDLADLVAVRDLLAGGSTLVLEMLHRTHRPVGAFCRRLGYELNRPVSAAAFLSPANAQGFAVHYDIAGVFTLQCEGHKTWEIHRPTLAYPLEHQRFGPGSLTAAERAAMDRDGPARTLELGPGDVLWMPRGWLHNVYTTTDTSLHVTVGVPEISRHRMLAPLLDALAASEEFRLDLPFDTFVTADRAEQEAELTLKAFAAWLAELPPADLAERARAALRASWDPPARSSPVTAVVRTDAEIAAAPGLRVVREAVIALRRDPDGRLLLTVDSGEITLDGRAAALVGGLLEIDDGIPVPVERFRTELGADAFGVVRTLLGDGVVELVRG